MESKMTAKSSELSKEKLINIPKKETLRQLNEYRLSKHLCDVFLVAGGREFPAHRAVLSAGGGFFRGLFASNMREQAEKKIELPQVDPNVMDDMLGYIYTGQIKLTQENAQLIIMAADFLLLEELKHPVDEFLAQVFEDCSVTHRECASTLQFAHQYNCKALEKVVSKQICKNFEAILSESEAIFLEFSAKAIQDIISSDDVVISGEEVVFTALMKWIRHREEREQLLDQMLAHLRLCSLPRDFIDSVIMKDPLVVTSPECISVVKNGTNTVVDPTIPNVPHPRDCLDAYTNAILVIPQEYYIGEIPNRVWCYIPSGNSWLHIPAPSRFGEGTPYYDNGSIFTVHDDVDNDNVYVDRYDINTNTWSSVINFLTCPTWRFSRAYLNGVIYLIGGTKVLEDPSDGEDCTYAEDVFACDLRSATPSFKQVASLNTARETSCVVYDDSYIYVIGGRTDLNGDDSETDSIERYDPESNSWSYLSPIQFGMVDDESPNQCILVNSRIFIIQCPKYSDVEHKFDLMYDIRTDTWSQIPPSPITWHGLLTYCEDKLYLISRCEKQDKESNIINTVCYDLKDNVWSDVISSVKLKVSDGSREMDSIYLAGTVVRLCKDFVSTLRLLEDVDPEIL